MTHSLDSFMFYVHVPVAVLGHVTLLLAFSLAMSRRRSGGASVPAAAVRTAWLFTFLGLLTGMVWAQLAFGVYWSWDPKETLTLVQLAAVTVAVAAAETGRDAVATWSLGAGSLLVAANLLMNILPMTYHSFA